MVEDFTCEPCPAHPHGQTVPATRGDTSRREAFAHARARTGKLSIPQLIELLASRDLRTRFLAEMSLRDATGT